MKKPYGRKIKKQVSRILEGNRRDGALAKLSQIPDEQLVGHLFAHLYHGNELIKFRSAAAMGTLGKRMARSRIERARIMLRRIMWNLNDESGGIGWGSPEAMGDILSHSPELALEFKSILFSYLDPGGNHIEHDMLQRGVLWGVGTYLAASPEDLPESTQTLLSGYLHSQDPVKRGYALRALVNAGRLDCSIVPEALLNDDRVIDMFNGWDMTPVRIKTLLKGCRQKKARA